MIQQVIDVKSPPFTVFLIIMLTIAISACGSSKFTKQTALQRVTSANAAVNQSIVNDARKYAPIELRIAERKLEEARNLIEKEEYSMAHLLAQQVELDAQYADSITQAKKAEEIVNHLQENNRILEEEIKRAAPQQNKSGG